MGRGGLLLTAALLAGCRQEPDFDERFAAAEDKIRTKAAELDTELREAERARRAAEAGQATPTPTPET